MSHDGAAPRSVRSIKVLIVEDEFVLAADLKETLETLGYTVTGMAASALETLYQIDLDHPDVVLMDIRLRGEPDGIETAIYLWDVFRLPVVYLTRHSDPATLARAQASLAFGYLVKPVRETELVAALNLVSQFNQGSSL